MPNVVNGGNGLLSSTAVAYTGADNSNIFARLGQANIGTLAVTGDITSGGNISAGGNVTATGDVIVGDDLFVTQTIECCDMTVKEVTGQLSGITISVNGTSAGRVNSDGTTMIVQGLTGDEGKVQVKCGTLLASNIQKDVSNNVTFTVGGPNAPEASLKVQNSTATYDYTPTLIKATSAISSGSTLSFTNTAEKLTNASFTAPYTGYYQFLGQVRITSISSFDVGTDSITFYADVSGGSLSPLVGSINDICCVASGSDFEQTISGYVYATAGQTIDMYHIDVGVFTITGGSLFILWKFMGAGTGLA